jgi:hypothetical protein
MPLPDTEREVTDIDDFETGETDRDVDRIMCCSVVNSYVLEILRGADSDSIAKQLREGQKDPERLRAYRGIILEKINTYNGSIGSPQLSPDKREEYENKVKALELLRDKIDIALRDSGTPDDFPKI